MLKLTKCESYNHDNCRKKCELVDCIQTLLVEHRKIIAALNRKSIEIRALRSALLESARVANRNKPSFMNVVSLLESDFSISSPCNTEKVHDFAIEIESLLNQVIETLRSIPEFEDFQSALLRYMGDAIFEFSEKYKNIKRKFSTSLANADDEIRDLQNLMVSVRSGNLS